MGRGNARENVQKGGERTEWYCLNAVARSLGLGVDRQGSRRVRRLRRDLPEGRRFGKFADTAAAAVVVVQGCSIPASQAPCPGAAAGTCSQYAAAAALPQYRTLPSPASLGHWSAFRAIASGSPRRLGQGLHGKNSCQFSLREVRIMALHHERLRMIRTG